MSPGRGAVIGPVAAQILRGLAMGAADVVPGVSGGTVALVLGIYERLVEVIRAGARALGALVTGDWRRLRGLIRAVDWLFLIPLAAGIAGAVFGMASVIETGLRTHPAEMAGLFGGLVAGSVVVASGMIRTGRPAHLIVVTAVAAVFAGPAPTRRPRARSA